ncbi:MAG: hypothetical protein AAGA69_10740 [Pseudomonadota bacterium]
MTEEKGTPYFPFYTGFGRQEHQMRHYTVVATGEVTEANEVHNTTPGPASLEMQVWAEGPTKAADTYWRIAKHIGFAATKDIDVKESVASTPTSGRPSAYNPVFSPIGTE